LDYQYQRICEKEKGSGKHLARLEAGVGMQHSKFGVNRVGLCSRGIDPFGMTNIRPNDIQHHLIDTGKIISFRHLTRHFCEARSELWERAKARMDGLNVQRLISHHRQAPCGQLLTCDPALTHFPLGAIVSPPASVIDSTGICMSTMPLRQPLMQRVKRSNGAGAQLS
jgi:hypothetical protein